MERRINKNFCTIILWIMLFFFIATNGYTIELNIYLKPNGSDLSDGLTKASAVASLQTAIDRALLHNNAKYDRLKVVVFPGIYSGQTVVTRGASDGKPLIISPELPGNERPRFDGKAKGLTWLKLDNSEGKPTMLTVEGLEIVNYLTAISLNGKRTYQEASNSSNTIRNNIFINIGQISNPNSAPSTAAIRLVNSDNNEITKNRFINIRNIKRCGLLHSIYIAHYSTGNYITNNVFDGGCGATIKVRDGSSENTIANNEFVNQEDAVYLDGFCDKNLRDDCTKDESECPSWNNVFRDNTITRFGKKAFTSQVMTMGNDQPRGCIKASSEAVRVRESNNLLK